jgi:phosphate starvation-inducible PhoH-like protein
LNTAPVVDLLLEPNDARRLAALCGQFDEHLRQIESRLGVVIRGHGNRFYIEGELQASEAAARVLGRLYDQTDRNGDVSPEQVHLQLRESAGAAEPGGEQDDGGGRDTIRTRRALIRPRSRNQLSYVQTIRSHDINFGIGPAGTGKTYLAVACAVAALESDEVRRIVLVRPAVEAGEKLGFLPGDLAQKIDPYLRPLYDALYEMMGFDTVHKLIERNVIEVAPLAYMRGRTLNNAYIILDEGQNTTSEQMKMFLTRIGHGSSAVITGDITQIDLPRGVPSGLRQALDILRGVPGIGVTRFSPGDVVRHPLVQRIVEAYEAYDASVPEPGGGGR